MSGDDRRETLLRILKTLLVVLVITWGVLALAVRAITPLLADYREELSALASERLGAPVVIGGLQARWYGLGPLLELHNVRVGEAPQTLEVERVELGLALTRLLHGSMLDALQATFDGLQLTVVHETTGQIHLEGLGMHDGGATRAGTAALPSHLRLIDTRLVWVDRRYGRAPLPIDDIDILIDRNGEDIELRARLQTPVGGAEASAELRGLLGGTEWSGDSYLRVDNLDVAHLLRDYLPSHYGLGGALLDLQAWTQWRDATPVRSQGRFALRDVHLSPTDGTKLDLKLLAANFSLERSADELRLGLQEVDLATQAHRWPRSNLALTQRHDADGTRHLELAAEFLRLEDVTALLQVRAPSAEFSATLDALQPRGEVRALRVSAAIGEQAVTWRASADFRKLQTAPWRHLPGIDNLSGHLLGNDGHLVLTLDSHDTTLSSPALFREPLELPRIAGRIDWTGADDGWELSSRSLQIDAKGISTSNRLHLLQRPSEPLFLDMQSDFRDVDAALVSRYYPTGIMADSLVNWLDGAIRSGRITQGSALVYGPVGDLPFEETRSGSFQVVFDTTDILLDYQAGWPAITGLDARVKFHGNRLDITSHAGAIYDSRIEEVTAHVESLNPASAIHVTSTLSGPLQDKLRVLGEPALRPRFGHFADVLRATGDSRLQLDFMVPLGKSGRYTLDGRLSFADNRLALPDRDFALDAINGRLDFTFDGLRADGIRARMLGAPITINVRPLDDGTTKVFARGRFRASDIAKQLDERPLAAVSGQALFEIDLDIPPRRTAAEKPAMLTVRSDLDGIHVDLPAPLGKDTNEARGLIVKIPLDSSKVPGSMEYGDRLRARFSPDGRQIDVQLGGDTARLQAARGIRIAGRLPIVDVTAWQAAAARLRETDAAELPPLDIDLHIGRLDFNGIGLDDLQLEARRDEDSWRGSAQAETLAGRFTIPLRGGRPTYRVELDRLRLALPEDDDTPEPPADVTAGPDPTELPGLSLAIADLQLGKAHLGALQVVATPTEDGLQFDQATLQGGQLDLTASGSWSRDGRGYRTRLQADFETADLGQLIFDVGYSRQLEDAKANGRFEFEWPGNPAQLHRATLAGRLEMEVGEGRLVEVNPGATRVVGLLNLNALTRRLRLDFRDFYKKGYSFDRMSGSFTFADGVARTGDTTIAGPTGRIDMEGSTNLVAEVFDQHVTVVPNLDATLPIAGTLAGGPLAGIAVLVAQKALSDQMDNLNRFEYRITGPWEQPEIKQLDTGGTLSKLLRPFNGAGKEDSEPAVEPSPQTPQPQTEALPQQDELTAPESAQSAPEPGSEPATATQAVAGEEDGEPASDREGGLVRGVLDFLKQGKPYGADLPGEGN